MNDIDDLYGEEEEAEADKPFHAMRTDGDDPVLMHTDTCLDDAYAAATETSALLESSVPYFSDENIHGTDVHRLSEAYDSDTLTDDCADGTPSIPEPIDEPVPKRRRSRRRKYACEETPGTFRISGKGLYVAHVHTVGVRKGASMHSEDVFPLAIRPGPPPHWTRGQVVRRVAQWLVNRYGTDAIKTRAPRPPSPHFSKWVALDTRLELDSMQPMDNGDWPRLHDVLTYARPGVVYDDVLLGAAKELCEEEEDENERESGEEEEGPYGTAWSEEGISLMNATETVSVVLSKVPAAVLLTGCMLLLRTDPRKTRLSVSFPPSLGVHVVELEGAVSPLDPMRKHASCSRSSLLQWLQAWKGASAKDQRLPQLFVQCHISTVGTVSLARAVYDPLFSEERGAGMPFAFVSPRSRAHVFRRAVLALNGFLEWNVFSLSTSDVRRSSALCRPAHDAMYLFYERAIFSRFGERPVATLCYMSILVLLSHVLPPADIELVCRGAVAETVFPSRHVTSPHGLRYSEPFDPSKLMANTRSMLAGSGIEQGLPSAMRNLPRVSSVIPRAEEWVPLVYAAARAVSCAYGVSVDTASDWPFKCASSSSSIDAPRSIKLLRMGHELFATPHVLLDNAFAPRALPGSSVDWPSSAYIPGGSVSEPPALPIGLSVTRNVDWDGSRDAVQALRACLDDLAHRHPTAQRIHLLLGGLECAVHFAEHVTFHLSHLCPWMVRSTEQEPLPLCTPCTSDGLLSGRMRVPPQQWVEGRRVEVHSVMGPLPDGGPVLVINAQRLPPAVVAALVRYAEGHAVVFDMGQDAPVPPEFRVRSELLPVLTSIRAATPARSPLRDDSDLEVYEDTMPTRARTLDAARHGLANRGIWFVRQPLSFAERSLTMTDGSLPKRGAALSSVDPLFAPRVLYGGCKYYGAGECAARFVLDPEMTVAERRWFGRSRWIDSSGASPVSSVAQLDLWVTGSDTRPKLPFLCTIEDGASSLFFSWVPVFSRLSAHAHRAD